MKNKRLTIDILNTLSIETNNNTDINFYYKTEDDLKSENVTIYLKGSYISDVKIKYLYNILNNLGYDINPNRYEILKEINDIDYIKKEILTFSINANTKLIKTQLKSKEELMNEKTFYVSYNDFITYCDIKK